MRKLMAGVPWGWLSDSYGRKPIILFGLIGSASAMLAFGFSKSYVQALISRTAAGLLNSNVGVIRTMVAEMVVERSHQASAFSVMPFVWSAGSILGPVLGGAYRPAQSTLIVSLADPARQYPGWFGNSAFFTRFPYALPNLVVAALLLISSLFGFLFMQETHNLKKHKPDLGIQLRQYILSAFSTCIGYFRKTVHNALMPRHRSVSSASQISEFSDDDEEILPRRGHRRTGSEEPMLLSPTQGHPSAYYRYRRRSSSAILRPIVTNDPLPRPKFTDILTKQVILNMVVYSGLALHTISLDQLFPLLCSTKVQDGGLGMTPGQIGAALSVAGIMAMVLQITVFPWGHNKFGGLFCLRAVLGIYVILYNVMPLNLV
jgi:MFS family permease